MSRFTVCLSSAGKDERIFATLEYFMRIKKDRGGGALAVSICIHRLCNKVNQQTKVLSIDVNI